jgi:hypothetical protein
MAAPRVWLRSAGAHVPPSILGALVVPLIGALLATGCPKKPTEPKPVVINPAPTVNSDAPNANDRIASAQAPGDPGPRGVILGVESADGSSTWFRGGLGGPWVVGRLGAAGTVLSQTPLADLPYDLVALGSSSPVPGGAIAVGCRDANGDGIAEASDVTLVAPTGEVLDHLSYPSDTCEIRLYTIASLSDSLFVVSGGSRKGTRLNPMLALLALTGDHLLQRRG